MNGITALPGVPDAWLCAPGCRRVYSIATGRASRLSRHAERSGPMICILPRAGRRGGAVEGSLLEVADCREIQCEERSDCVPRRHTLCDAMSQDDVVAGGMPRRVAWYEESRCPGNRRYSQQLS